MKNGIDEINTEFTASIGLGAIGTLLFFRSLSGFLIKMIQNNKKLYFMYANASNMYQLASYDGNIIRLVPNAFMGSTFPKPPPGGGETGPYTQSLSNIVEMKAALPKGTIAETSIYPNPASSIIKINSSLYPASIKITDISGRIVLEKLAVSPETIINVSELISGTYILHMQSGKSTVVEKFVKN